MDLQISFNHYMLMWLFQYHIGVKSMTWYLKIKLLLIKMYRLMIILSFVQERAKIGKSQHNNVISVKVVFYIGYDFLPLKCI